MPRVGFCMGVIWVWGAVLQIGPILMARDGRLAVCMVWGLLGAQAICRFRAIGFAGFGHQAAGAGQQARQWRAVTVGVGAAKKKPASR